MNRSSSLAQVASGSVLVALTLAPGVAAAQASPLSRAVVVGGWSFRPEIEVRTRAEVRTDPVDTGGDVYGSSAVLAEGFGTTLPPIAETRAETDSQWIVGERARIGLTVDRGPLTGVFTLQDARLWGSTETIFLGAGQSELPSTAPWEAYLDVHTRSGRRAFFRMGRQRVVWGDGRLLGESDWAFTPRSLDALRFGVQLGDIDLEAMASLLSAPGATPPSVAGTRKPITEGTGAQLYGLDAVWHVAPLLQLEVTGLARVVREPRPSWLTPGDTFVVDARVFGEHRGFSYAAEGAYEFGRVATYGDDRPLSAFALAARAGLETALPWHLTFGARGAYASGDDGELEPGETQTRFDPILPDERRNIGLMGLYGWSNLIEGSGTVEVRPVEELSVRAGYTFAALAQSSGRWVTARLLPVGAVAENGSRVLGHEVDAIVSLTPWEPLRLEAGYGLFLFGEGGKAILTAANRPADMQHFGYLQATLRAP
ncbi:alginate export family protein [Chondromyces apiculatus]|nr:alginate export family protein [Chondromyces apiculatus]